MNIIEKLRKKDNNYVDFISTSLLKRKIAHAFIFFTSANDIIDDEPELLINSIIDGQLTSRNNLNYSDIHIIDGSKGIIKKDDVVDAIGKMSNKALDKKGIKILYIRNIENGNKQSLNSLLKFIEEPSDKTYIIMTTNNIKNVLKTIKSRAQNIRIKPLDKNLYYHELAIIEDETVRRILTSITSNKDNAIKKSKSKVFLNLLTEFKKCLEKGSRNNFFLSSELNLIIKRSNVDNIVKLLDLFYNDIWRIKINNESHFPESLILKYKNNNFSGSIIALNQFKSDLKKNVNFDLAKSRLLIELEKNYE